MLRGERERRLGIELALEHDRRRQAHREREVREAPGVEQRRGDHRAAARAQRDALEQRRHRVERLRLLAARALRGPGRAGGEDHGLALLGRRREIGRVAVLHQLVERLVGALALRLVPGDVALAALRGRLEHVAELLVEDDRHRVLALGDVGELRAGERRVHEQRVGAQLVRGDVGVDPAAVVAAHDRHRVTGLDALVGERMRERVRTLVQLLEGERAALVDQAQEVRVARSGGLVARGRRRAPADQRDGGAEQAIGPLRTDDPGAGKRRHRLQLAGDLPWTRWLHRVDYSILRAASTPVGPRPSRSSGGCPRRGGG